MPKSVRTSHRQSYDRTNLLSYSCVFFFYRITPASIFLFIWRPKHQLVSQLVWKDWRCFPLQRFRACWKHKIGSPQEAKQNVSICYWSSSMLRLNMLSMSGETTARLVSSPRLQKCFSSVLITHTSCAKEHSGLGETCNKESHFSMLMHEQLHYWITS